MVRSSPSNAASPLPQPNAAEVRAHLEALLRNEALAISDRNRRFLAYIVEETLAGRGDRIKAYNVALTAFDRTDDFDPQTDPIVRIEASRLRRALEHYYLTAGKADSLRIGIPKGSYVATFSYAELEPAPLSADEGPAPATAKTEVRRRLMPMRKPPLWWVASIAAILLIVLAWILPVLVDRAVGRAQVTLDGPSILVLPFDSGGSADQAFIARGINAELIGRLTSLETLSVLGQRPASSDPAVEPSYVLSGSAHATESKIYISAVLADSRTGRYLWAWNVERDFGSDVIGAEAAIAAEIADHLTPMLQSAP
jgi:adenylate cyclase